MSFDQAPISIQGRTLVPLRAILEELGANIDWNQATQTVTATRGQDTITLTIGKTTAYKNGTKKIIDVAPVVVGGRTMLPLRFVAEELAEAKVEWNEQQRSVFINSSQKQLDNIDVSNKTTPLDQVDKQYVKFKEMFSGGQIILNQEKDMRTEFKYNGSLSSDDFFRDWNAMDKETKRKLAEKLGAEIQLQNPKYDIAIDFYYQKVKLGYVIAYSSNYQLSSFIDNLP